MKRPFVAAYLLAISAVSLFAQTVSDQASFSFVFISDVHIQPERGAVRGYVKAIESINKLTPDFVINGGDLLIDATQATEGRADSLFSLYTQTSKQFKMPVYNGIGNHDLFAVASKNTEDKANPLYGKKMFEAKVGPRYQSFDHKGWKFFVLDDIMIGAGRKYKGGIDTAQLIWLKSELAVLDKQKPIVISLHIPLLNSINQFEKGSFIVNDESDGVANAKELLDLFKDYNLKIVLQGHLHTFEDDYVQHIHFVVGGAISGWKWNGSNKTWAPGFVQVKVVNGVPSAEYVPYGWKALPKGSM